MFANELDILQKDKKEIRDIEKQTIEKKYDASKDEWVGKLNLSSDIKKDKNITDNISSDTNRSVGLGFSQSIYESGGIEYSIGDIEKQTIEKKRFQ